MSNQTMGDIPIWRKYTLSIEEAAIYFRIGEGKLRKLISENPNADFILWNGNRMQIKRVKFEAYIDRMDSIKPMKHFLEHMKNTGKGGVPWRFVIY